MARASPVWQVSAGLLCPWPRSRATAGLASSSMPTAAGMMRASMARQPVESRARKAVVCPVDHFSLRSGVTTDMMVTATIP